MTRLLVISPDYASHYLPMSAVAEKGAKLRPAEVSAKSAITVRYGYPGHCC